MFQKIVDSSNSNIPNIVSDLVILSLTDISLKSAFLERHTKTILEQLIDSKSYDDIYMSVVLYWSIYRFLDPVEVKENTSAILDSIGDFEQREQARILLLMILIEEDKKTVSIIRRQMNKLVKRSPEAFRALLPAKRKGFR